MRENKTKLREENENEREGGWRDNVTSFGQEKGRVEGQSHPFGRHGGRVAGQRAGVPREKWRELGPDQNGDDANANENQE